MTDQFIVFELAGTAYALPSERVAHVEMVDAVTRVPNAPHFVDGVVFSRGVVVPAVSLRARFGFEREPYSSRTRLLVVHTAGRTVGLIVDSAREFIRIPADMVRPPHDSIAGPSGRYLAGIATLGERMILVLDLDAVLNPEDSAIAAAGNAVRDSQETR
jgi:purine-binding chemotaxis protein CheW